MMKITLKLSLLSLLVALLLAPAARAALDSGIRATLDPAAESKQMIAVLQSDADHYEKALACRRLAAIGAPDSIPVLAKLLGDEKLGHMARFGLEAMPDPAAGAALREAMGNLKGQLQVGAINSVGMRRDAAATAKLLDLMKGADAAAAAAAAAALGRIANPEAVKALTEGLAAPEPLRAAAADAGLTCAERLIVAGKRDEAAALYDAIGKTDLHYRLHQAALQGSILARGESGAALIVEQLKGQNPALAAVALRTARLLPGPAVTQALTGALGDLEERQMLLVQALGDRADPAALSAITACARQGAPSVRLAAVRALGRVGDASAVPILLDGVVKGEGELAQAAMTSLVALPGKDVNAAIVSALAGGDPKVCAVAIELADQRRIEAAVPALLKVAAGADAPLRLASLKALRGTIGAADFGALVGFMVTTGSDAERTLAQAALVSACARITQKEPLAEALLVPYQAAASPIKIILLPLLAQIGGEKALAALRAAAAGDDAEVRDAALRAICQRSNPDVFSDLIRIAKTGPDQRFRILALQGQINLIPKLEADNDQKLAALKDAIGLITRKEEKQLALAALAQIPTVESLALVEPYLGDPELKEEAAIAAIAISEKVVGKSPAAVDRAMKQVKSDDWHVTGMAKALLARANGQPVPAKAAKARGQGKGKVKDQAKAKAQAKGARKKK